MGSVQSWQTWKMKNSLRKTLEEKMTRRTINSNQSLMAETTVRMKKEINLTYATAMMTGCIIGSGIFVSPISLIRHSGSVGLALVLWVFSGLLTTPVILSYAELGIMFPSSGAEYVYYNEVLGPLPSFLVVWVFNVVILPAFYAVLTLTTTNYLFYPFYHDCSPPQSLTKLVSTWLMSKFNHLFICSIFSYTIITC